MQNELSRRDFLKLSGLGLAELFTPPPPQIEITGVEKLGLIEEMGLENYIKFYEEGLLWQTSFGIRPPLFDDILDTLNKVANGEISKDIDPNVALLKFGWGENKERMVEDAIAHIRDMEIDTSITGDDPEKYRAFLYSKTDKFPQALLASPNKLVIEKIYGYAAGDSWGLPSLSNPFLADFPEIALLHEIEHLIQGGRWKDIKQYVNQEKFGEYLRIWLKCVRKNSEQCISNKDRLSPDFTNRKWHQWDTDNQMFTQNINTETKTEMINTFTETIKSWEDKLGIATGFNGTDEDIDRAWSTLAILLTTNLRYFSTLHPGEDRNTYIDENRAIIEAMLLTGFAPWRESDGKTYTLRAEGWFFGVSHHLIGPVETDWSNIPAFEPTNPENYLDLNNQKLLQDAYLAAFSTLGDDTSQYELRNALDLPLVELPAPVAYCGTALLAVAALPFLLRKLKR